MMYVGDSLSVNNFESLLCLIHGTVPGVKYKEELTPPNITVTFQVPPSLIIDFPFFFSLLYIS